ncbi:hypothetical protein [Nonlabens tegetincola]|uniref:hypothetical protein n=1 Tax=Nonlabens tegetincola TaxID=323273 RepID=UPI000CF396A5|nr:hypothetical protein [Nonlabens tegetincola]PQJ17260.1 hypothetical protein BST93_11465 [Nonlabens tegetincola]
MKHRIVFQDQTARKYVAFTSIGIILIVAGVLLLFTSLEEYVAYLGIGIGIALFFYINMNSFRSTHFISYNRKGITLQLLGRKTNGFSFNQLQKVSLEEKGLLIKLKGGEVITLSRKRYLEQSLQQLFTILKTKTSSHE